MSDNITPAPTPVLMILIVKHDFVRTNLDAGKVPTAPMLASFLQALVQELGPHVKAAPPPVNDRLKSGLSSLGWNVASNSPAPGSAPPQPQAVLEFLDGALAALLPTLSQARAAAAQATRQFNEEERELGLMEEEALEGALSGKQQKTLAASQARLPRLKAAAAEAAGLVKAIEARLSPDDRAAAEAADEAQRGVESLRIAQLTKDAAEAAAGGGGGGGGGKAGKGGRGGGGGRGRGGGRGGEPLDREARAAEAAAKAGARAAADAKAADEALAALRTSDITLVEASELRKGGHVLLQVSTAAGAHDEPCRIVELSTSKTGKHGHAKISVVATDVASGRKVERNLRADERVTVPGKRWLMAITPG